jgi:hypothetical protein
VAEPFFVKGCKILVDDTNWDAPSRATLDFIKSSANSYRILFDKSTRSPRHPTFWNGIMVFERV